MSGDDQNFSYTSPGILLEGDEKFDLVVKGQGKVNCGCVIVKSLGSQGFKMKIDTTKLTKKDVGEYTIQTLISLEGN